MNILVFIHQVMDPDHPVRISPDKKTISNNNITWMMNPHDEYGLEEAIRIKDETGGYLKVLTIGSDNTANIILKALALGADEGIIIKNDSTLTDDPFSLAELISTVAKLFDFDLIFTGSHSTNENFLYIGALIAQNLDIPYLSNITKLEVDKNKGIVKVNKAYEEMLHIIEADIPALVTIKKGTNELRPLSMQGIKRAKLKPIRKLIPNDLGINPDRINNDDKKIKTVEFSYPFRQKPVTIINGKSYQDKSEELFRLLHEELKLI
jgi:electron transfer flavoprotein beta subunit